MQSKARHVLLAASCVVVAASAALADTVRLKDGTVLQGDVKRGEAGWVVTTESGAAVNVSSDAVQSIEVGKRGGAGAAMEGLASLRRSSEAVADPKTVIERYKQFLARNKGTPAEAEAVKDLATWQDRLDRGLVRVGSDWLTPGQRDQLQQQAIGLADQARQAMKDHRNQEAEKLVAEALKGDPRSATALYLRALLEYQAGQLVPARKDLEQVKAAAADHGPTLNNLAVITWRQNRQGEALNYLDQAMQAMPENRTVLDNVAETLHAATDESAARGPVVQKAVIQRVTRRFQEQEPKLEATMKQQGLNRWGATWVNDADLARVKAAEKENQERVAALQGEFDSVQQQIRGIDDRIAADQQALNQMQSNTYRTDMNGVTVQVPLPAEYYQVEQDITAMQTQRQQAEGKLEGLRQQAKTIQQQLPVPPYTGVMQMVGADGAPIVLADATTRPAGPSGGK